MISVIVPVYQTERYLPRCIDSILSQSFCDFELLLIDDGSKDDSGAICDRYARKDGRVRVFHKENSGVSDTRNYGLDHAKGEYITFVDSDDYIGRDYLRILMETALENDADISIIHLQWVYSEDAVFMESSDQRTVYSGREAFRKIIADELADFHICAKLFKADRLGGVRFPAGRTFEDLAVIPYIVNNCRRCAFSTAVQYYYFQRSDSITHCATGSNAQNWIDESEKLLEFTASNCPEVHACAVSRMVKVMFWAVIDWHLFSRDYASVASRCRDKIASYKNAAPSLPGLTGKERIKLSVFKHHAGLYRLVRILFIRFSRDPDNKRFLTNHKGNRSAGS